MAKLDPAILAHLEWLGFVRPTGLVVSAPALVRAGAILDRRDSEGQRLLRECTQERVLDRKEGPVPWLPNFRAFAESVLGWSFSPKGYAGTADSPIPPEIEVHLPEYGETLRPDFGVRELEPKDGAPSWQLLVRVLEPGTDFDWAVTGEGRLEASPHSRMERLLRQTGVPAGLLFNGRTLRLLSAPRGESSGWLDFHVADMVQTAGRPISTALRLLLGEVRLLSLPRSQRLAALLEDSRKFQNEVSERLAEQVLHALYELLRGIQAAHDASKGELLREVLADHPNEVYRGLLTVLLRLVFLLYAEERDMLPEDETFVRHYSLAGLYERLRADAALHPDTMEQRFGAWAQLLVLFRMIHDGAEAAAMRLPRRHGVLFDPDRFPFLEGRLRAGVRQVGESIEPPHVPDGTIYRALEKLVVLDGERISYRALDVEQIGSVYETMMGFRLESATGRSIAIKAQKKHGAPTAVDLEALLAEPGTTREKWLQEHSDRKLTDRVRKALKDATTLEDLHAALLPVADLAASPDLVPRGAIVLQPSEERRRSGSHYTPRSLTEPIVRTTLGPILARFQSLDGRPPRPEQILDLKICDPAMGSGAFLVEACRQLGDALIEAWRAHSEVPAIPPDEDEVVYARRLVAQRCLYGVDRNPVAVDLTKVSLWLVTLAKDHAFTFLDHALRHGDSLVGLSRCQLESFHWESDAPRFQAGFEAIRAREHLVKVSDLRQKIREAGEEVPEWELRDLWDEADFELGKVRLLGDLAIAAYFLGDTPKEREQRRSEYANAVVNGEAERHRAWLEGQRNSDPPLAPFHWEIEFPEVFDRQANGFDAFCGNPPFLGGSRLTEFTGGPRYQEWLKMAYPGALGQVDFSAYFFRRAFGLLGASGALGFLATNTIYQGDTRAGGIQFVLQSGGRIYSARRAFEWPGDATVTVSAIHIARGAIAEDLVPSLDGKSALSINSRLRPRPERSAPKVLAANSLCGHYGTAMGSSGFIIGQEEYDRLILDPKNAEVLLPLLGGEDANTSPTQAHTRYAINFGTRSYEDAQGWPEILEIVRERVKPGRDKAKDHGPGKHGKKYWWQHTLRGDPLYSAIARLGRCLVGARVTTHWSVAFVPTRHLFNEQLSVFAFENYSAFAILQSRVHEMWARLHSSGLGEALRYSVTYCFDTFPFPQPDPRMTLDALESAGLALYRARADYLSSRGVGLTCFYNDLLDVDECASELVELRKLHEQLDEAVLRAYGLDHVEVPPYCFHDEERYLAFEDEVMDQLYVLNARRADEEAIAGLKVVKKRGSTRKPKSESDGRLFL